MKYQVIYHYDVWGNPEDGFQVNDSTLAGELDIYEESTDLEILAFMVEANLIDAMLPDEEHLFEIDGDDLMITVDGPYKDTEFMMPYYTLVLEEK
jgi:hypothetical protein